MFRRKTEIKEPEKTPREIGRDGTMQQFREAHARALANQKKGRHLGTEDQLEMRRGAIEAFHAGHREKIQTALFNTEEFTIWTGKVVKRSANVPKVRTNILIDLIKGSDDPVAVINLALEKFGTKEKQQFLDKQLNYVVGDRSARSTNEPLIAALLKAGADANAFGGLVLALAAYSPDDSSVVEMLYKNEKAANFNDALRKTASMDWSEAQKVRIINALMLYRQDYTDEPADRFSALEQKYDALEKKIGLLQQQFNDLQRRAGFPATPATPAVSEKSPELRDEEAAAPPEAPAAPAPAPAITGFRRTTFAQPTTPIQ